MLQRDQVCINFVCSSSPNYCRGTKALVCCCFRPSARLLPSVHPEDLELELKQTEGKSTRQKAVFQLEGMTCASCSNAIESHCRTLAGVESVSVSLVLERGELVFDACQTSPDTIVGEIEAIGFGAKLQEVSGAHMFCCL